MIFPLARDVGYIDLNFLDVPGVIGTGVLTDSDGVTLIDPGPSSCLDTLRRELSSGGISLQRDVKRILLTHIHLDHAGATGSLLQNNPAIEVWAHEKGTPHLIDPAKLLESATRLFGTRMADWGAVLPVPAGRVKALHGGERLEVGGRQFEVAYTPGHASHHVGYFEAATGVAWIGDTGGVRVGSSGFVVPPTPPPDIDLDLWRRSLDVIRAWKPATLFVTHFGPIEDPPRHLDSMASQLHEMPDMVRRSLEAESDPDAQFAAYEREFGAYLRRFLSSQDAAAFETVAPSRYNWLGLVRYWRKRAEAAVSAFALRATAEKSAG
jgi:glyoxylase-like metal-dependent hydrolase (beta-lactamase superfamily II)